VSTAAYSPALDICQACYLAAQSEGARSEILPVRTARFDTVITKPCKSGRTS
jgi:hypothetical protein